MAILKNEKTEENYAVIEFEVPVADIPKQVWEKERPQIEDYIFEKILPKAYEDAIRESGHVVVARPQIELAECTPERIVCRAGLTTFPKVELGPYKGLKVVRTLQKVREKHMEKRLSELRKAHMKRVSVKDRRARKGDIANIDYVGYVDGKAFDGGSAKGFDLTLGRGMFIEGFEDQVVGHKPGEEFDIYVTFPDSYSEESLAGKDANFKIKLNSLSADVEPEPDDDFARNALKLSGMDEAYKKIRESLEREANEGADRQMEDDLVAMVVAGMKVDVPQAMYESQMDEMLRVYIRQLARQGLDFETYIKYRKTTKEKFRETFRQKATDAVNIRLAMEAVAMKEGITVSEEEYEEELKRLNQGYDFSMEELKLIVPKDSIMTDMAVQKAIDLIVATADITYKDEE